MKNVKLVEIKGKIMKNVKLVEIKYYKVIDSDVWSLCKDLESYSNSGLINQYNDEDFSELEFSIEFEPYLDGMIKDYLNPDEQMEHFQIEEKFELEDLYVMKNICKQLRGLNEASCIIEY